jgi:AraC-like DNA-binding protein
VRTGRDAHQVEATSSTYPVRALLAFAAGHGIGGQGLLETAGLDAALIGHEQARVPRSAMNALWNTVARALHDPFLGLHFGESFARRSEGHILFTIMRNSPTLREALFALIRYHGLMTDIVTPSLSVARGKARVELIYRNAGAPVSAHLSDSVLAMLACALRSITEGGLTLESVRLAHPGAADHGEYVRIFGKSPVFRSGSDCLVFDERELRRTFPLAQERYAVQLCEYAQELESARYRLDSFTGRVSLLLERLIEEGGDFSLAGVAAEIHVSGRLLQKKLRDEETTFQTLLDDARKTIAIRLIDGGEALLCDIAFLLGFSEQSSFNRAFRRWTGMPPGEYRNKNAQG